MANRYNQAMTAAAEYRRRYETGDVVLASEIRRTIETLVGKYEGIRFVLPRKVAETMGRPDLAAFDA